ncbi:signal transduction histidine kinase [Sphingomonas jinjuensis]|uniref:histidine kinase n=1 Tax=Sphingomonas jinjuensis TaxID=535907 RepID=A0A840FCJ3_9SPHN|nr:ATP-binding protein [Sphingomonas jinjuensis]MBB4154362.1 signal transduction histidine kinase [Sphingomonas jinjuensis]
MIELRSLRALTGAFVGVLLIVTTGAAIAIHQSSRATIRQLVDARLAAESRALAPDGVAVPLPALSARIDALARARETGDLGFELIDGEGRRRAGNIRLRRSLPEGFSTLARDDAIAGLTHGRALVRRLAGGARLVTVGETEPIDHYDRARVRIYLIGFGAIVVLVVGAAVVLMRAIRRRMRDIDDAARAIMAGDLARRVPVDGSGSEFERTAVTVNAMLDRIEALMAATAQTSSAIAHELRTPLTRLRNRLAVLPPDPTGEAATALADVDEALATFSALLRIAEIENGAQRAGFTQVWLARIAREAVELMMPLAEEAGRTIAVLGDPLVSATGDARLLMQVMLNLIDNALKHGAGAVTLTVLHDGSEAVLVVEDQGPGIAAEARATALRRFGRLDRTKPGHGMGLALVDAVVRLHYGRVTLDDAEPGLRVILVIPALPAGGKV